MKKRNYRKSQDGIWSVGLLLTAVTLATSGCGQLVPLSGVSFSTTPIGVPSEDGVVVRARVSYAVDLQPAGGPMRSAMVAGELPVQVDVAASVGISLDTEHWVTPAITPSNSNEILDFGTLGITGLFDNDLKVCGEGHQKCNRASIRIYTSGPAGGGFWNSEGRYGAPLFAGLPGSDLSQVGFEQGEATILQSVEIPENQNVLRRTDFNPEPVFAVHGDFRNAGAGRYSTQIVVEYVLSRD